MGLGDEMSRIAIIGSSGYLGSSIAFDLIQKGHDVIGVFRNRPVCIDNSLQNFYSLMQGDITDHSFLHKITKAKPEILIYLVSLNHKQSEISLQKSLEINVAPLLELGGLFSAQENFKKLIYMSTMQVYGTLSPGEYIDENYPIKPNNMYGLTHYFCEEGLNLLFRTKRLHSVSLRLSNGYGFPAFPSSDCWTLVINDLCRSAVFNGKIKLMTDGSPQRDFIHISDISRAVEMIATSNDELPRVMNLASENTLSILELALLISQIFRENFNMEIPIEMPKTCEFSSLDTPNARFQISCGLLKSKIRFEQQMPLKSGIKNLIMQLMSSHEI